MIKNEAAIERCRRLIEAGLQWGDPAGWTNEDFEDLSDRIFEGTAVRLSVSTLKRIWGKVRYESSPTTGTLNALARFAGFAGWREFLQQPAGQAEVEATGAGERLAVSVETGLRGSGAIEAGEDGPREAPGGEGTIPFKRRQLKRNWGRMKVASAAWLSFGIAVVFGLLSFFGTRFGKKAEPVAMTGATAMMGKDDGSGLTFESRKVSEDLPNSVVFNYDATPLQPRSVIIQQSWDTTRREMVDPAGKAHTSQYFYPGYFIARLIVDGETKKRCEVFIKTKGWKGIIEKNPLPIYLTEKEISLGPAGAPNVGGQVEGKTSVMTGAKARAGESGPRAGRAMGVTAAVLQSKTGSALFSDTWVEFVNVREFPGIPADHFMLRATLRNTSAVEQCLCRKVKVTVLGTGSAIIIPLADKGCISDIGLLTGNRFISGKDHDLSAFGCDFRRLQDLVCKVQDHRLVISLNGAVILDTEQPESIGKIVGIRVAFEGTGEIRDLVLTGPGERLDLLK